MGTCVGVLERYTHLKLSLSGILVSPMLVQKCCSVGMVVHEQGPKSVAEGVGLLFSQKYFTNYMKSMIRWS